MYRFVIITCPQMLPSLATVNATSVFTQKYMIEKYSIGLRKVNNATTTGSRAGAHNIVYDSIETNYRF